MGNDERSRNTNIPTEQLRGRTSPDEYGRRAESDCARAMAEIERVLHELALTRRSNPERSGLLTKRRMRHPWFLRLLLSIGLCSIRA
jgi:hypothetical protein